MNSIKEQVDHGSYSVDPHAVADAILRRLSAWGGLSVRPASGEETAQGASE